MNTVNKFANTGFNSLLVHVSRKSKTSDQADQNKSWNKNYVYRDHTNYYYSPVTQQLDWVSVWSKTLMGKMIPKKPALGRAGISATSERAREGVKTTPEFDLNSRVGQGSANPLSLSLALRPFVLILTKLLNKLNLFIPRPILRNRLIL